MKFKVFPLIIFQIITLCGVLLTGACTQPILSFSSGEGEAEIDNRRRTGECARYERCQEICDEIFELREDRELCEEFSMEDVEKLRVVSKIFKDFDRKNSTSLDLKDLEFLLNISSDPLEKTLEQMSDNQKDDFLVWLAADPEATGIVGNAEKEFEFLKQVLGPSESDILSRINKPIDDEDTVIEIALNKNNRSILEWFHDFFGSNCEKNSSYETCIFTRYYCHFSLSNDSLEKKFFKYPFFTEILNKVLREHQPARSPSWWTRGTTVQDLESWQNYPHNVCAEELY